MRNAYLVLCLTLLSVSAFTQNDLQVSLYFQTDEYVLSGEARAVLKDLIDKMDAIPVYSLEIQAHTDSRGSGDYNQQLADRRAQSVHDYLAERNIAVEKTAVLGYGELAPAFSNRDEEGRARNRRVDVLVTPLTIESLGDLMSQLGAGRKQIYKIDAGKDIKLTGEQGTTIWIDANAFQYPDGRPVTGEIMVSLQEAYQYADMVLAGLSTHSGDRLLETGGMVEIQAMAGGEKLQLKKEKPLVLAMPTPEFQEGMQLFTGVQDESGRLLDWAPTGQQYQNEKKAVLEMPEKPIYPGHRTLATGFKLNLSGKPAKPVRPLGPHLPHKPERSQVKYNPGLFKRLVMGKEKITEVEDKIFAEKMAGYEEKLRQYEEALPIYEEKLADYEEVLANYEKEHAAWEASLAEQRKRFEQTDEFRHILAKEKEMNDKRVAAYEERLAAWNKLRDQKLAAFETHYEANGKVDAASVNNYFFSVNQLGWINCDRFYNIPAEEKMQLAFLDNDPVEEEVFVIFKASNSILRATKTDNFYLTNAIPRNSEVVVIGMKVENGRVLLARKADMAGRFPLQSELDYQPTSLREMRLALEELN